MYRRGLPHAVRLAGEVHTTRPDVVIGVVHALFLPVLVGGAQSLQHLRQIFLHPARGTDEM